MSEASQSILNSSIVMFAVSLFLALYALISGYIYSEFLSVFFLISSIIFLGSFITAFKSSKLKEDNIRKEAFINTAAIVLILGLVIMTIAFFLVTLRV